MIMMMIIIINMNDQVTKCTFHKYGPSGTVTRHDGLCILALNIINEKVNIIFIIIIFTILIKIINEKFSVIFINIYRVSGFNALR